MNAGVINGFTFGFASMKVNAQPTSLPQLGAGAASGAAAGQNPAAQSVIGWKGLSYEDGVQEGWVRTNSPMPLARTRGEYTATGSLSLWKGYTDDFIATVGGAAGIYDAIFTLTVVFQERQNPSLPVLFRTLVNCRITKITEDAEEGPAGLADRLSLSIQAIGRASGPFTSTPKYAFPFIPNELPRGIGPGTL